MKFEDEKDPKSILSDALENLENAEEINEAAEKVQQVLGTEPGSTEGSVTFDDLLEVDEFADEVVQQAIADELAPPPPSPFCVCAVTFNISNAVFTRVGDGSAAADLQRRMGDGLDGRGDICGPGEGSDSCNTAIRDLFGFQFPRLTPTFTFLADQYILNPDGSVGTCVSTDLGVTFTITGTGTLNGTPGFNFILTLLDGGMGNQDSATLTIPGAGLVFTANQTISPGQVMVRMCP
ncbi:hypothetical protein [Neobacillus rhizophilus]|uniref:Uncharacterized protein n=1 Tax=Neobacillus rhizophilus TaxID=2833579 RepID=A0A942UC98_9BACI|nr:hypothetical protein [Neobacillus rhizophilus]MBS4214674.1 hypothetical protein [Neobacillus rhizophilus]